MASVLHGSARTTPRIRAELKAAKAPARVLASRYGLNVKTVLKWRNRVDTADAPMGPKPKSTVLTPAEEAIIVEFRRRTLLALDDVLGCLKDTIPNLTRSSLHRCLQRHGISRLPAAETTAKRKRFKTYDIEYIHIDSCELNRCAPGQAREGAHGPAHGDGTGSADRVRGEPGSAAVPGRRLRAADSNSTPSNTTDGCQPAIARSGGHIAIVAED
jgi:hypothetical protein